MNSAKSIGVVIIIFTLFSSLALATTPAEKCEAMKNRVAGKYALCLQKAEATLVLNADATRYADAIVKCGDKFSAKWVKVETGASGDCPTNSDESAVQSDVISASQCLATQLAGSGSRCCVNSISCAGACVDPTSDESNCGACGNVCSPGTSICVDSACISMCLDGFKDGAESDIDCGGGTCPPCAPGKACLVATDCSSSVCSGGICRAPACDDAAKNGTETDIDCGGGLCPRCGSGKACLVATDCSSSVCSGGICRAPACDDGVMNGTETGVDCGGSCPACPP